MYILKRMTTVLHATLLVLIVYVSSVSAAVITIPHLDIRTLTGDAGVVSSGGNLIMDATATSITTNSGLLDIVNQDFLLTATYSGSSCNRMMGGSRNCTYSFANGTLNIGSLLTAEVNNLTINNSTSGHFCPVGGSFSADLVYTEGSLQGGFANGVIKGNFFNAGSANFSQDFSADFMKAKIDPIATPLPASFFLFGAGLIGLVSVARRRCQSQA